MEYEEKYKQALKVASQWHKDGIGDVKTIVECIFPELRESEDERIRRELIKVFEKKVQHGFEWKDGIPNNAVIAWLEKQGEQKLADKVEPKFKVKKGKWYVCTNTFVSRGKIIAIKGQTYQSQQEDNTITCEDNCLFVDRHDGKASDYFRYWTIQDANDGDILCGYPTDDYPWIGIFHELNDDGSFKSYCYLEAGIKGKFCPLTGVNIFGRRNVDSHNSEVMVPATKEQRDLLFFNMKEAGYEWDANKKELKKIEQKPAWSEEDKSHIGRIISYLESFKAYNGPNIEPIKKEIDWLKTIKDRVQPQQEWSEEDERNLECIINEIEENKNDAPDYDLATYDRFLSWLKSIKPNHWKPSEEQLNALWDAVPSLLNSKKDIDVITALSTLYDDLKNL